MSSEKHSQCLDWKTEALILAAQEQGHQLLRSRWATPPRVVDNGCWLYNPLLLIPTSVMGFPDKPEGHTNTAVWTQLKVKGHCETAQIYYPVSLPSPWGVCLFCCTPALWTATCFWTRAEHLTAVCTRANFIETNVLVANIDKGGKLLLITSVLKVCAAPPTARW